MTGTMNATITCPRCNAQSTAEIWTSVNRADDPDVAQWLIDGFIFEHECPDCGAVMTLNHDCLYHDPAAKLMIQYAADPGKREEARDALEALREKGYHVRLATSRHALREKAAIARDGLDDRAVELVKFLVFNKFAAEGGLGSDRSALYGALAENGDLVVEFVGAGEPLETVVPRDVYEQALEQIRALDVDDPDPALVDRNWAASIYDKLG